MLGAILGDIVGSPFEFDHNNYKRKDFALLSEKSHFTDDTVMTAAVKDKNKLGKIFLHNKCPPFCGVSLSLAKGYHKPEGKRSTGRRQITHPAVPDSIGTAAC